MRDPRLTEDCQHPAMQGETYGDLAVLALEQARSLEECTARMKALRQP